MRNPCDAPPRRAAGGFTLVELLITLAVATIATLLVGPRIGQIRDRGSAQSARVEITAAIESARAAAMQRGRTARVQFANGTVLASVDTGPPSMAASGQMQVLKISTTGAEYGVTLVLGSAADTLLVFDPRGFAHLGRTARYVAVRGAARDSVCVGTYGTILPRECTP